MAAETIKGLNLEISGETTSLQAALSDVNKKSRDLQSELSRVEKLLKLDPSSTELLAQKQKLLAESVENTKEKLDRLKTAQEQINEQFKKGEINEGQYRAFQREVIKTEQELKKLEKNLKEVGQASSEMGSDIDKAGMKLNELGDNAEKIGGKMKDVGEAMSVGVTAPIIAGMALATEGTEEFRTRLATLETNAKMAGQSMGVLHDAMRQMQGVTGELDSNVEGLSNILAAGFKGEQLTALVDQLAGASIKFKDTMKFEGIADGLQETLATGKSIGPFDELLSRCGVDLNKFNAGLKDAIANGTQNQYVLDVLANEGLADVYEQYRKNNEELVKNAEATYDYQQAMADLGNELVPILTEIQEAVTGVVDAFNKLPEGTQDFITKSALVLAAIGPLLFAFSQLAIGVSLLATAFGGGGAAAAAGGAVAAEGAAAAGAAGGLTGALAGLLGYLPWVAAGLAGLAAGLFIGDTIMKLWGDDITAFVIKLLDFINFLKTVFLVGFQQNIAAIKKIGTDIKTGFLEGIAAIKKAFTDFGETIKNTFKALKESVVEIWTGLWESVFGKFRQYVTVIYTAVIDFANLILDKWDQFKFYLIDIWEGVYIGVLEFINGIIRGINNMIKALNSIKFEIPDWVPRLGGKKFDLDIEELKEFDTEKLTADSVKQKIEHTGRITIEGVNNKDELIASVDLIWDDLLDRIVQEVRG